MKKFTKRKGFTLVELLIVIIVIGILASGMMLAAGSATTSAKAATVISELRSAKAAGIMWMADHINDSLSAIFSDDTKPSITKEIKGYMDNETKAGFVFGTTDGTTLYIGFAGVDSLDTGVMKKISDQSGGNIYFAAKGVGTDVAAIGTETNKKFSTIVTGGTVVWMRAK